MTSTAIKQQRPRPRRRLRRLLRPQLRTRVLAGVVSIALIALAAFDFAAVTALRQYLLDKTDSSLETVLALTRPRLETLLNPAPPPNYRVGQEFPAGRVQPAGPYSSATQPRTSFQQVQANATLRVAQQRSILGDYYVGFSSDDGSTVTLEVGPGTDITISATRLRSLRSQHKIAVPSSPTALADAMFGSTPMRLASMKVPDGTLIAGTSLDDVNHTVDQLELIVILGSLAAVGLIGGGVLLLLRRGLRPIEAMAAQAGRMSGGDLTGRVRPHDPRSEVGRLGAALNGMLARIQASIREREAGQEVMRRFFADASHELRTPLASLRANAELYQQGAVSERSQLDEVMRRISLETQRMSALVDDMLRLARLDQHPDRARDEVDVSELVASCVERAVVAEPDRTWEADIAPGMVTFGDEELLRRAVDNLIANVHAHTPEDTVATIIASPDVDADDADCIVIEVNDDGPGVPPDKLPRIFDRFYRAANPSSSRPGSGLGLAIVAEIAAAHHGAVGAELNDPQGLRVTVTLPVETEPDPEPPHAADGISGCGDPAEPDPDPGRVKNHPALCPPLTLRGAPDAASVGTPVQPRQAPKSARSAGAGSDGSSRRPSATAGPSRH
ncbi:MAG TPA: HAMP domain-containing sensor histidine kinase [Actinocrinis sp.]|jgi:two-component system OmpR family sensor kinase